MVSPSICGGFLNNRKAMVAFSWAIATALNIFGIVCACMFLIQIESRFRRLERYYESDEWLYQYQYNQNQGDDVDENRAYEEAEESQQQHILLATTSTQSIAWVALYVLLLSGGLVFYGSTAVIGFTSLNGKYIAPCFSSGSEKLRLGIFGGAVVVFSNLLLLMAVILGEVRVVDGQERRGEGDEQQHNNSEDRKQYRVERIAAVLAVTCMFLSALYTIFAVLLFLSYAGEQAPKRPEELADGEGTRPGNKTPLVNDNRTIPTLSSNPGFITIDHSN
ncbi:unnamed protein product [Cylindrotheca closterium]|uniref:Transmembrane protein n=1 Tax=Cylindrotheca closterium TaxID=2856 RepID=A0AAD2CG17_9STRA|nr:unnamed protein product [Cylindrotheca closterium]